MTIPTNSFCPSTTNVKTNRKRARSRSLAHDMMEVNNNFCGKVEVIGIQLLSECTKCSQFLEDNEELIWDSIEVDSVVLRKSQLKLHTESNCDPAF